MWGESKKSRKGQLCFHSGCYQQKPTATRIGGVISIKTGCCLKASSCQVELPLHHRHHNRGRPSHNSVWLAQGENGSLRRMRRAPGWQVCICEARRSVYLLSFCLLNVSVFTVRKATWTKWHGEWSAQCEEANVCLHSNVTHTHTHTDHFCKCAYFPFCQS